MLAGFPTYESTIPLWKDRVFPISEYISPLPFLRSPAQDLLFISPNIRIERIHKRWQDPLKASDLDRSPERTGMNEEDGL